MYFKFFRKVFGMILCYLKILTKKFSVDLVHGDGVYPILKCVLASNEEVVCSSCCSSVFGCSCDAEVCCCAVIKYSFIDIRAGCFFVCFDDKRFSYVVDCLDEWGCLVKFYVEVDLCLINISRLVFAEKVIIIGSGDAFREWPDNGFVCCCVGFFKGEVCFSDMRNIPCAHAAGCLALFCSSFCPRLDGHG